jgi:hypothetical protein
MYRKTREGMENRERKIGKRKKCRIGGRGKRKKYIVVGR